MKEYEITYLANPELTETAKDKLDEAVDGEITKLKGEITASSPSTDAPGSRRRLHYPIKHQRMCWLRTVQVNLAPNHLKQLRTTLTKQDGIMRLTILQTPQREEVSAAIFDSLAEKEKRGAVKEEKADRKEAKEVTMKEVEEKIEKALEEEVK